MHYHLDTIPVWDAMKLLGECPLCAIRRKVELNDIQRCLGGSVMEPDVRIQVNQRGFCTKHQQMLFSESNKLGHALMLHTHLMECEKMLTALCEDLLQSPDKPKRASFFSRAAGKAASEKANAVQIADKISELACSCVVCDSIHENMERYTYTFLHLWKTDKEFEKAFAQSKGLCLPDMALLMKAAPKHLSGKQLATFLNDLVVVQTSELKRIEQNVYFFTQKFDYRNQEKPWGDSKNAIEKTVNKLNGWCVGDEPNPRPLK